MTSLQHVGVHAVITQQRNHIAPQEYGVCQLRELWPQLMPSGGHASSRAQVE